MRMRMQIEKRTIDGAALAYGGRGSEADELVGESTVTHVNSDVLEPFQRVIHPHTRSYGSIPHPHIHTRWKTTSSQLMASTTKSLQVFQDLDTLGQRSTVLGRSATILASCQPYDESL